jgi:hypothetical protein
MYDTYAVRLCFWITGFVFFTLLSSLSSTFLSLGYGWINEYPGSYTQKSVSPLSLSLICSIMLVLAILLGDDRFLFRTIY